MIDLKKPLEGAPGLLLMAFLLLLGAAIGLGVAILLLWIPMSDAFANFLGGVVGAGLGAIVAIGGAVYVQRRDRLDRMAPVLNSLRLELREITNMARRIVLTLKRYPDDLYPGESVDDLEADIHEKLRALKSRVGQLQSYPELPRGVVDWISVSKSSLQSRLDSIVDRHEWVSDPPEIRLDQSLTDTEKMLADLDTLQRIVERSPERHRGDRR